MGNRMQQVMCSGTLLMGLFLVVNGDGQFALFGWFVMVLGLLGVLVPAVLTRAARRAR